MTALRWRSRLALLLAVLWGTTAVGCPDGAGVPDPGDDDGADDDGADDDGADDDGADDDTSSDDDTSGDDDTGSWDVALYDTFEITLPGASPPGNWFASWGTVTFTDGSRTFEVDAFYDGNDDWRARFFPDAPGIWDYSWSLHEQTGGGSFVVGPDPVTPSVHGHVHRDTGNPRFLRCDDGTPHHWIGGKWFAATHVGPPAKDKQINPDYCPDATITDYLDDLVAHDHNGTLLKTALFPIEDDGWTWDLEWLHRMEWFVREAAARGIYVQVNLFDTWSRAAGIWFDYSTDGDLQPFNVWTGGAEDRKQHYLRTLVARFAGYYNVYWELGNEMEHAPNDGASFVAQANANYIPWIHQFDPYDLPIGLSEGVWSSADVDIGFLHQTSSLTDPGWDRPSIMNELVSGGITASLWEDAAIRDPANRIAYRRAFWRMYTFGGSGCSEATWLQLDPPPTQAVYDVMADHAVLAQVLQALPCDINQTQNTVGLVSAAPGGDTWTRHVDGQCYLTYLLLEPGQSTGAGSLQVTLPAGNWDAQWIDPPSGAVVDQHTVTSDGSAASLDYPGFTEDLVLVVTAP